ncbi:MAG TPA: LptF/LptG family permease [Verrucomicrobiae bacterium]|nr:LptF/LptG family permease [Verrucomicrobiae bacterium]
MRTLHRYVTRQIVATMLMTVVVFTFVLLLGNVLKEILGMLVNRQATLMMAVQAIGLLIPFVLVFALPMGLLTATLLVFGRFSADQELTAVRASGISLVSVITPVLLLSTVMSLVSAWVNLEVAPKCRVAYKRLLMQVGLSQAGFLLPEKTFIKDFPNKIVYIGNIDGPNLKDILIYNLNAEGKVDYYIRAKEGKIETDEASQVIHVQLTDAWRVGLMEDSEVPVPVYAAESSLSYTNRPEDLKAEKMQISDMTFQELRSQLQVLEQRVRYMGPDPVKLTREEARQKLRELKQFQGDITLPIRLQIHSKIAFSFASIGFTLVGIPLGIRAHRRETTFGIALALILVMVYYSFFIIGQSLDTKPQYYPHLILWVPNFLFQAIGMVLLWRANRGV